MILSPALTTMNRQPLELDTSGLRAHMKEFHPSVKLKRANADLPTQHAHHHTRYHTAGHSHLAGRIKIRIHGLPMEYDEGWLTGAGAMTPAQIRERLFGKKVS